MAARPTQAAQPGAAPPDTAAKISNQTKLYPKPSFNCQTQPWPCLGGKMDPKPDHGAIHEKLMSFGGNTPLGQPGQPAERASTYVQLAAADASYAAGQV